MQSDRLWAVEVRRDTTFPYTERVSLWILAQTMVQATRKAERLAKKERYKRPQIMRIEDKGTIDVF